MAQLGSQELGGGTFAQHLVTRKQKRAKGRRMMIAGLTLTSMVDMFSLLVIFLLQTFSTSPELVMVTKGVTLPAAVSGRELEDSPVLALSAEEVYLDQKLVGKTEELLKDPSVLMNKLAELREQWLKAHPNQKFNGLISLQADKNLPSTTVSMFMGMLPTQTYSTVQLAVISRGGS
jgi:biopolymer transport protein ExbD